jgi:hypothetical protein
MSRRGKFALFVLTPEEQRAIAFLVLALILGLWTKHYRLTHPPSLARPNETPVASVAGFPSATASPAPTR